MDCAYLVIVVVVNSVMNHFMSQLVSIRFILIFVSHVVSLRGDSMLFAFLVSPSAWSMSCLSQSSDIIIIITLSEEDSEGSHVYTTLAF